MATEQEQAQLVKDHGDPIRTETVPCVTEQWNHPHAKDRPWVDNDGTCEVCGQAVDHTQLSPDRPYAYTRIAKPHTRTMRWFAVDADRLHGYDWYMSNY